MPRLALLATIFLLGACGCGSPDKATPAGTGPAAPATEPRSTGVKAPSEAEKIEALIKHVEGLPDAVFVRNGKDYDAPTAGKFLRGKWEKEPDVKTARQFIDKVASTSSTSGKPYLIRFKDGKEVKSGDYLSRELEKLEKP